MYIFPVDMWDVPSPFYNLKSKYCSLPLNPLKRTIVHGDGMFVPSLCILCSPIRFLTNLHDLSILNDKLVNLIKRNSHLKINLVYIYKFLHNIKCVGCKKL